MNFFKKIFKNKAVESNEKPNSAQKKQAVKRTPKEKQKRPTLKHYTLKIAGDRFYQAELEKIAGDRTAEGVRIFCDATLLPNPNNIHDANAVEVWIGRRQVGHLPRKHAAAYTATTKGPIEHPALIYGGWYRDAKDCGDFHVKLKPLP